MLLNRSRFAALVLSCALVLSLVAVPSAPVAQAAMSPDKFDSEVVRLVNVERAKRKLPTLTTVPKLKAKARGWSAAMRTGTFKHAPRTRIAADNKAVGCTTVWAENIYHSTDMKPSPKATVKAYMASPDHRAVILGKSYRFMASGSVLIGNKVFNTQRFAAKCKTSTVKGWSTKQSVKVKKSASDTVVVNRGVRKVTLQKYSKKKWVKVKTYKSNSKGRLKVVLPKTSKVKKVKYRLVVSAKGTTLKGVSKTKTVTYKK